MRKDRKTVISNEEPPKTDEEQLKKIGNKTLDKNKRERKKMYYNCGGYKSLQERTKTSIIFCAPDNLRIMIICRAFF